MTTVRYSSRMPVPPETLFDFHHDVSNLPRISPPFPRVGVDAPDGPAKVGQVQHIRLRVGPWSVASRARITRVEPPRLIEDVQVAGTFHACRHQHSIAPERGGSRLTDVITFRLAPTWLGQLVDRLAVRPVLWAMLWQRHRRTRAVLAPPSRK
jgi:ligand-binding SRPBCC domain-containing protein